MMKTTQKTGTSIEHNRFYLIVNEILNVANYFGGNCFPSQYKFIVAAYSWINEFREAQRSRSNRIDYEEYQKNIIYNGIGYDISDDICLDYGLLNTDENRKKASKSFLDTFPDSLTADRVRMILMPIFDSLKDEYVICLEKSTINKIQNPEKLKKQIRDYLVEPLKAIENPYEQLAGVLIYAQSGCLPLDVYKIKLDKAKEDNRKLNETIEKNIIVDTKLPQCLYECDYWGYFFNSQYVFEEKIDTFKLRILHDETNLTIYHYATDAARGNQPTSRERTMTGKIIHNQSSENKQGLVVLDFASKENDFFCTMAFNAIPVRNKLHLRRGALLIQNRRDDLPVIQSFIFTRSRIDLNIPEKEQCIRGLLKLNSKCIYVEKDKAKKYIDDELLKEYVNSGHQIMSKEFVEINESLLSSLATKDKNKYISLLKLRVDSLNPSLFVLSEDPDSFHHIAELYDSHDCEEPNLSEYF